MAHLDRAVLKQLTEGWIVPDAQEKIWDHLEREGGGCNSCWNLYQECISESLSAPLQVWAGSDLKSIFGRELGENPRMQYTHQDNDLVWELDSGSMDRNPKWVRVSFDPSEEWYLAQILLNVKELKDRPGGSGKTHLITKSSGIASTLLLVNDPDPRSGISSKPGYYPTLILHRVTELDESPARLIGEFLKVGCYVIATCPRESLGSLPEDERTRSVYYCYTDEEDEKKGGER